MFASRITSPMLRPQSPCRKMRIFSSGLYLLPIIFVWFLPPQTNSSPGPKKPSHVNVWWAKLDTPSQPKPCALAWASPKRPCCERLRTDRSDPHFISLKNSREVIGLRQMNCSAGEPLCHIGGTLRRDHSRYCSTTGGGYPGESFLTRPHTQQFISRHELHHVRTDRFGGKRNRRTKPKIGKPLGKMDGILLVGPNAQ